MTSHGRFLLLTASLFSIFTVAQSQSASALSLGVMGGASILNGNLNSTNGSSGPALLYGAEATFGTLLDTGVFYEKTNIKNTTYAPSVIIPTVPLDFYGLLGRVFLGSLFADAKVGLSSVEASNNVVSGQSVDIPSTTVKFGYGIGVGFKYSVAPFFALLPRLGYRSFSGGSSTTDLNIIFSFLF